MMAAILSAVQGFEHQSDPPKCAVASTSFPSLAHALAVPWKDLIKRHFPISEIYVRSRVIHKFRCDIYQGGGY
jgi:hypothetical protein